MSVCKKRRKKITKCVCLEQRQQEGCFIFRLNNRLNGVYSFMCTSNSMIEKDTFSFCFTVEEKLFFRVKCVNHSSV